MTASKRNVLLVDDEEAILDICREVLEMHGFGVKSCLRAQDALTMLENEKNFDIIVSDFKMPNMNGLNFLGELRRRGCQTPFVLLTGEMDSQNDQNNRPDVILYKPIRIDDLVSAIGKVLQQSRSA